MSKNQKFSRILEFTSKADFSALIQELRKVQAEASKHGASNTDIFNIGSSIEKMEELQIKIKQAASKGFSNPKEASDFEKMLNQMLEIADGLQYKFEHINVKGLNKKVKDLQADFKKAKDTASDALDAIESKVKSVTSSSKNSDAWAKGIRKAVEEGKSYATIEKEITNDLKERIRLQEESLKIEQKKYSTADAKIKNYSSLYAYGSFTQAGLGHYNAKGIIDDANKSEYKKAASIFQNIVQNPNVTNATQAMTLFKQRLSEIGIIIKEDFFAFPSLFQVAIQATRDWQEQLEESKGTIATTTNELDKLTTEQKNVAKLFGEKGQLFELSSNFQTGIADVDRLGQEIAETEAIIAKNISPEWLKQLNAELKRTEEEAGQAKTSLQKTTENQVQFEKFSDSISMFASRLMSLTTAFYQFRRIVTSTYNDVKQLDKAFGSIAMVTSYSVGDLWQQYGTYADMANKLGQTTQGIIEASSLYYQQGLNTTEVMSLTEETMKLATLAGLDFKEATSQMTAAIRAFKLEMTDGAHVTDVYAELAAHAAASVNDISEAMSATAAIAHSAGMEFETTSAMLTTMIEATQEAPKNLGTALKAVIARFTELKKNVAGTSESEFDDLDYNKVDTALKSVGVQLKDTTGQFRDLDDVFRELAAKWDTLDRNSQRYVATIAAGSRQQSRFIALMENSARMEELITTAYDSAGKSSQQFAKFQDTVEFKVNRLKNTWEQARTEFLSSDFYKDLIDFGNEALGKLKGLNFNKLLAIAPIFFTIGRKLAQSWLEGFKNGAGTLKAGVTKILEGITGKRIKTTLEIQTNYNQIQEELKKIEIAKQALSQKQIQSQQVYELGGLNKVDSGTAINNLRYLREELQALSNVEQVDVEQREQVRRQLQQLIEEYEKFGSKAWASEQEAKEGMEQLIQQEKLAQQEADKLSNKLSNRKLFAGLGTAIGSSLGTGISMAIMGTFDASQIFKTLGAQNLTTAVTQLMSGNWQAALGAGLVSAASFGISKLSEYFKEQAEKARIASDKAYALRKEIKELEQEEEQLTEKVNNANSAFEKQKETHEKLTSAVDTYEKLSNKISKTEEEQQELNSAVEVLASYSQDLILGYNEQGDAIFRMGQKWDTVIEKEKEAYDMALKNKLLTDVDLAKNQKKQAEKSIEEKKALGELLDKYKNRKDTESYQVGKAFHIYQGGSEEDLTLSDALDLIAKKGADLDVIKAAFHRIGKTGSDEHYLQSLIEEAATQVGIEWKEYDDIFKEFEKSPKKREDLQNLISKWLNSSNSVYDNFTKDLNEANLKLEESRQYYQSIAQNAIENLLSNNKQYKNLSEKDQKQFLQMFTNQYLDTLDKVKNIVESDAGVDFELTKILSEDKLLEEFAATPNKAKIAKLLGDLYTLTPDEAKKIVSNLNIGSALKEYLLGEINEVEQYRNEIINKIASIIAKPNTSATNPGQEYQNQQNSLNEAKESPIVKHMETMGAEAMDAFINSFAGFSEDQQKLVIESLNELLGDSFEGIKSEILTNLMSVPWQTMSVIDLIPEKNKFIKFAEEQGMEINEAEKYWNQYKDFMSNLGILDIAKENFSGDALLTQLEESLNEKLKSAKISDVISNSIRNGFINFADSNTFRKACEQLGLNAADYIEEGIGGMEKINVNAFEKAIRDQADDEESVIETLRQEYKKKIEILESQKKLIEGAIAQGTAEEGVLEVVDRIGDAYEYAAAKAWALANGLRPEDVTVQGKETFKIHFDKTSAQDTVDEIDKQIEDLNKVLEEDLVAGSEFMNSYMARQKSYYYEILTSIAEGRKSGIEAYSDLEQAKLDQEKADKALSKAEKDLEDKLHSVNKALKEWNEARFGDPNRVSKLDGLNNYSAVLDDISRKASKAKEKLDDLSKGDNVDQLLATYTTEIHNEVVTRGAENEVIKQAIANTEAQLSKYSDYYSKIGDIYVINYEKLNSIGENDKIADKIEEDIEKIRSWTKTLQDNEDAVDKLRKQFEEDQKKALQNYVNMEKEVVNSLKEQYEKEVNDLKEKNEAMKDADDDYLDALEKAIDKERKLRNRQNQWDDLAKKEKKLSLISRDTSGAQQLEAQKLQQEVEKDRTQLLDDTVDDIIDSLKEMYELQQESREAEVEYMESMLDNAELIKEANAIIQSWSSNEDAVNWFLTNKDLTEMSAAEIELEKKNWNDLYEAKILYEKQSRIDFDSYLEATQAEINSKIGEISQDITDWSEKTWNTVKEEVEEAIYSAKQAYDNAVLSYNDQQEAMKKLQMEADAAKSFYLALKGEIERITGLDLDDENLSPETIQMMYATKVNGERMKEQIEQNMKNKSKTQDSNSNSNNNNINNNNNNNEKYYGGKQTADYNQQKETYNIEKRGIDEIVEWMNSKNYNNNVVTSGSNSYRLTGLQKLLGVEDISEIKEILSRHGLHGYVDYGRDNSEQENPWFRFVPSGTDLSWLNINSQQDYLEKKRYSKFAKGGLVDYTGPAWVDGSPSNPEAFLSVDDTRLIGNLINLLTNIPSLNPNTNPTEISTSNIGDTTVNLTVNFDSVSEDYDAERVIDLMKEKIVEAANYTGANVILNKR